MGSFVKGDVVVLPFPYTDFSETKNRPALVLAAPRDDELIVCQITGQHSRPEYAIPISDDDFQDGGLSKASFARANHLFTIEPSIVKYRAGILTDKKVSTVIDTAIEILREK